MTKQARKRKQVLIPRRVSVAMLVALAVIAVGTVGFAMVQLNGTPDNAGKVPAGSQTPVAPEPTPEPEPEPEVIEEAPAFVSPVALRLLSASAAQGHLLRGTTGACPDVTGSIEVSFDSGASWQSGSLAGEETTRLLQFDGSAAELDRLAALNGSCESYVLRSFIGGTDWEPAPTAESAWFIDPNDANLVHSPTGATTTLPCSAVALASVGDRGIVLCSNSSVTTSTDAGAQWSAPVAVPNGVSVGASADQFLVASGGEAECAGVRTRTFDGAAFGAPGACVSGADGRDGQIALAGGADGWYLWVADAFVRSGDTGGSWS